MALTNPSINAKTRLVSARLQHPTADALDNEAKRRNLTRSAMMQVILDRYLTTLATARAQAQNKKGSP